MRGISNENTFIIVEDATGKGVLEVSEMFAAKHALKHGYTYQRPSVYLLTLNKRVK